MRGKLVEWWGQQVQGRESSEEQNHYQVDSKQEVVRDESSQGDIPLLIEAIMDEALRLEEEAISIKEMMIDWIADHSAFDFLNSLS